MAISEAVKAVSSLPVIAQTTKSGIPLDGFQLETASFILALAAHVTLFGHGEWDLKASSVFYGYVVLFGLINAALFVATDASTAWDAAGVFARATSLFVAHGLGLIASICAYRLFFHRLRSFPGPAGATLSGFYMFLLSFKYHQSETLRSYHEKFGEYVRVGPNKLSITDPAAIAAIYGRASPVTKGTFSNTNPRANLNMCRDKAEHTRRRKFWDRALSTASVKSRVPVINKHAERLMRELKLRAGKAIDLTAWLNLFSFDVLFDVGFGKDKKSLDTGKDDYYMGVAQQVLKYNGLIMHSPWMLFLFSWSPTLRPMFEKFRQHADDAVHERLSNPGDRGDLFSMVMRSYNDIDQKSRQDFENIAADADLLVMAGADSIVAAIASLLYQLAINPKKQNELRKELEGVQEHDFEEFQLRGNEVLNAYIHESLRLAPPAVNGHERMTPPEGLRIGEKYIPGNVSVFVPHYTLFRDQRFWNEPDSFRPERWTTNPELNKDASIFFPFQTGRHMCPGRPIALMETRTIVTMILNQYTVEPAEENIATDFLDDREDRWLLAVGKLNVVLRPLAEAK